MKRQRRPSFARQLRERYGPNKQGLRDGARPLPPPTATTGDKHLPRVYPTAAARPAREQHEGVVPMTVPQFVTLSIVFIVIAWFGAVALAYGVVQATAGGPEGPMGQQGIQGVAGPTGPEGPQGLPGNDASQEMVKRLAGLWAVQQASVLRGGAFVELNSPEIGACVQYIFSGKPGVAACPGFSEGTPSQGTRPTATPAP